MTCRIINKIIHIFLLINFLLADKNTEKLFEEFKTKYNRIYYGKKHEQDAFNNFVNNMNKVYDLNAKHPSKPVAYMINKYADLDPEEINESFGITITPYSETNKKSSIRTENEPFLEDMHLYNLKEVGNLYQDWLKKTGKANYTKKYDRELHYYRFIKTVVEINRQKAQGMNVALDGNADTVQHSEDYFYG